MQFTPLASSSKGNCCILEHEGSAPLLLECGIPIKQLREKLSFGLSNLAGCLVSHSHGDHSRAVKDILKAGIDCYMSAETAKALAVEEHYRIKHLPDAGLWFIDKWSVLAVPLEHDVPTIGFFIGNGDERFLFIPDTGFVRNRFQGITTIAIECNHLESILSENIINGNIPAVVGRRVRRNHMSLERLLKMLCSNDLTSCRQIYLMHLSDANSDENKMVKAVQEAVGIPCYAC